MLEVKFGDLGLSKDYDNLSTICGTWDYLAPEIYRKKQRLLISNADAPEPI